MTEYLVAFTLHSATIKTGMLMTDDSGNVLFTLHSATIKTKDKGEI